MIDCKKLWRIGINRHSVLYPIPQHPSPHQYIHTSPQRTTKLRGRRGGARGGEMAFATMNASPPRNCRMRKCSPRKGMCRMQNAPAGRRYTCRMRNAPAGRRYICRMQNAPLERKPATCEMPHPGRGFTSHKFHAKINKKITKE